MDRQLIRDALRGGYTLRVLSTDCPSFVIEEDQTFETMSEFEDALMRARDDRQTPAVRVVYWRLESDDSSIRHDGRLVLSELARQIDFCQTLREHSALQLRRASGLEAAVAEQSEALKVCAEVLGEERPLGSRSTRR